MTVTLTRSVAICASQVKVFKASTDWNRQREWMLGTNVRATEKGGQATGGKIEAYTGLLGVGFTDTMTITNWKEPEVCSVLHTGRIVRGSGTFKVSKVDEENSIFIWSEDILLPLGMLGRVGWFFVRPIAVLGVTYSLQRFKAWVETYDAA